MKRYYLPIALLLLLIYAAFNIFIYDNMTKSVRGEENTLRQTARAYYENIVNMRSWNAQNGGIYSDHPKLEPNPYLINNVKYDSEGKRLVKINPAWMTRQLSELSRSEQMHFFIVSNNPINPVNKAKGFYAEALADIEKNDGEDFRDRLVEGSRQYEYIGALRVENACLKCHAIQGYKVGDIRGGIAIAMDATYYYDERRTANNEYLVHVAVSTGVLFGFLYIIYGWLKRQDQIERLNRNLDNKVHEQTYELSQLNKELLHNNRVLDSVIEGSKLGYWDWNLRSKRYEVNERWLRMLGLERSHLTGTIGDLLSRIPSVDKRRVMPEIIRAIREGTGYNVEYRLRDSTGHYIWIEGAGGVVERDQDGRAVRLSGTHQDITARKKLEAVERKNREYLNILFDEGPNMAIVTNGKELISANRKFFEYFDEFTSIEEFRQQYSCVCDLFAEVDDETFLYPTDSSLWVEDALRISDAKALIEYDGREYYFRVDANRVEFGGEDLYLVTFTDITQIHLLQLKLEEISIVDELTGLYNRRYFNEVSARLLNEVKREKMGFAFLMMDIDNFKNYNDHYGHDQGDVVLSLVSAQLKSSLKRATDYLFRLGGEEFGAILIGMEHKEVSVYASQLCRDVENLGLEHRYNGEFGVVTISIGVEFVDFTREEATLNDIYRNADQALYEAKGQGKNRAVNRER